VVAIAAAGSAGPCPDRSQPARIRGQSAAGLWRDLLGLGHVPDLDAVLDGNRGDRLLGVLRLTVLPEGLLDEMTVNGRIVAATNGLLLHLFVPFVAISMAAHLLILRAMFSGDRATGASTGRSASPRNSLSPPAPGSRCSSPGSPRADLRNLTPFLMAIRRGIQRVGVDPDPD
jgi:hypothetical protein